MSGNERSFEVRVEVRHGAWRAAAWASSDRLDRIALVVDFRRLRALLEEAMAAWSASEPADRSAPALAGWLLDRLRKAVAGEGYRVDAVEVGDEEGISFIVQDEPVLRSGDPDRRSGA